VTPERWTQIEELFHRAADCPAEDRDALLDEAGHRDPELRKEVAALLVCSEHAPTALQATVDAQMGEIAFPLVGQTISHYRILGGLGGGGMGLVYSAEDIKLGRRVAIKFLPENSAQDVMARQRFEREARSASSLENSHICPVYEFGDHEGQPFLVMPLLEGKTLQDLISRSSQSPIQVLTVLDLAIQITQGLEAAHGLGIIHRDIKPGNIFVTKDGQAKILDFGLAKLTSVPAVSDEAFVTAGTVPLPDNFSPFVSQTAVTMGTVAYMSPEQIRGEKLDVRTDLFSLGLVLYEMTTGVRTFEQKNIVDLQPALLTQSPKPVRDIRPGTPVRLESIINKSIAKGREDRYQSASQLRTDLQALRRRLQPKSLLTKLALIGGSGLLAAMTAGILLLRHPPKIVVSAPEIRLRQLTTNSSENPVSSSAISPDGKYLAYVDIRGVHLKLISSGETHQLPEPPDSKKIQWEMGPWFPDSKRFVMNAHPAIQEFDQWSSTDSSIWVASVLGGSPLKLRDHAVVWSITPDAQFIYFGTNKGQLGEREIWRLQPDGTGAQLLRTAPEGSAVCCSVLWPDGQTELYISTDSNGDKMLARNVKSGTASVVILGSSEMKSIHDMVWLPEGRMVYALRESEGADLAVCNYWSTRFNLNTGERLEKGRRLTNWPNLCPGGGGATRDGKLLTFLGFSSVGTSYLADLEKHGTRLANIRHFTLDQGDAVVGDWSHDGRVALVAVNRHDRYDVYEQSLDGVVQKQIATSVRGGLVMDLMYSPDQKWILALIWPVPDGPTASNPDVPVPAVRIPASGGSPESMFDVVRPGVMSCSKGPSAMCVIPEQTSDHKQMVVSSFDPLKGRGAEIARYEMVENLGLMSDNLICSISPDGTRLAISRGRNGPIEIHSLRGLPTQFIKSPALEGLLGVAWASDANGFLVTKRIPNGTELLHIDDAGHVTIMRKCLGRSCFGIESPDHHHFAFYEEQPTNNVWLMENF